MAIFRAFVADRNGGEVERQTPREIEMVVLGRSEHTSGCRTSEFRSRRRRGKMGAVDEDDMIHHPPGAPPSEEPVYSDDGVDLTLIRWMLSLTPAERLRVLQEHQDAIDATRGVNPEWIFEPS